MKQAIRNVYLAAFTPAILGFLRPNKRTSPNGTRQHGAPLRLFLAGALAFFAFGGLSACSSQITQHGHLLTEADLAQVQNGMSKQQVQFLLGTPDTTATYTGDVYYYISSKMETKAFLTPEEIDRRVVAVYFAPQVDTVQRVAHYGLKDGKVFDFISRETPSLGQEASLINQLFRGLGAKTNIFGG